MYLYLRLGKERAVFDAWLREHGLMDRHVVEIRFGEGIHHVTGVVYEHLGDGMCRVARAIIETEDGSMRVEPIRTEWEWAGPLPPESVLEKVRELEAAA